MSKKAALYVADAAVKGAIQGFVFMAVFGVIDMGWSMWESRRQSKGQ